MKTKLKSRSAETREEQTKEYEGISIESGIPVDRIIFTGVRFGDNRCDTFNKNIHECKFMRSAS